MLGAIPLWLHILGATVWIGSQVMMFAVVVPSLRAAEDGWSRYQVLQAVTVRFGYLGFGALILLVITGIENIFRYAPSDMFEFRYGYILAAKLSIVAVVIALTAVHTLVIGPRLLAQQARDLTGGATGESPPRGTLRRRSIVISATTLVLSLAIVFCAVLLRTSFAFRAV